MGFYTPRQFPFKVKVSNTDTDAKYLIDKLIAGAGITINQLNTGGDEQLEIVSSGGSNIQAVDISSQFDGVATTFTIPQYSAIKLFIITGWPPNGALRPTTDFTTPTDTTVALTSEVSAPMGGTTGIILYEPI